VVTQRSRGGHIIYKQFPGFKRILKHSIHPVTAFFGCPLKKYSTPATTIIHNTKVYIQYYKILLTIVLDILFTILLTIVLDILFTRDTRDRTISIYIITTTELCMAPKAVMRFVTTTRPAWHALFFEYCIHFKFLYLLCVMF
jgi:hypothetical protein